MSVEQLLAYLAPFVVWGVTALVVKFVPQLPGWVVVSIVVPVLSALQAFIAQLAGAEGLSWLQSFGLGLAATFVHELFRQLTQLKKPV